MKYLAVASLASLAACAWLAPPSAVAQGKPHQHGVVKVDVAVEGGQLTVALEAPLDSVVGFERAPRTDAERRTATEALARAREAATLFKPDAAAQCTVAGVEVQAPVLEAGAKDPKGGHAEMEAVYRFQCAQPQQLKNLQVGLFDAFKRIQRIEVQVAAAKGQSKTSLKRPASTVPLQR
ncbi:MAG: hypothetical protein AD742_00635 [Methylibium sp. NZG]|nr:MAG: hypothetical protein AD742_00635 [Methylibium sp. NZG]